MGDGGEGQVVLAFEVVKEAALGDPGVVADVVDGSGGVAFAADDVEGGVEQADFGCGLGVRAGEEAADF